MICINRLQTRVSQAHVFHSIIAAALVLIGSTNAFATSLRPINLAETVDLAKTAFVGHITNIQLVQTRIGAGEQITANILRPVFGVPETSSTAVWIQFRPGAGGARLAGMPQFQIGKDYLIYLSGRSGNSPYSAPIGFGYGSFLIHKSQKSSATLAQNEFHNWTLYRNLDTGALSRAMVARDSRTRALPVARQEAAARSKEAGLRMGSAGAANLDALIEASQTMKALNDSGSSASKVFFTKAKPEPLSLNGVKRH